MLVYGDHHEDVRVDDLTTNLRARLLAARRARASCPDAEALRELLVLAGQLEQAIADAADDGAAWPETLVRAATANAAAAFYADWSTPGDATGYRERSVRRALDAMDAALSTVGADARRVRLRVPEGFAFYALFPEQYAGAAAAWLAERPPDRAIVLGLRSIGTSLGALVGAALDAAGWETVTVTARPFGDPWARRVTLRREDVAGATFGLVVDEGPGLSGSSMAAAAQALIDAGVAPARIVLFTGHAGDPGHTGSDAVRARWRTTARRALAPAAVRVAGRTIEDALAARVEALLAPDRVASLTDVGGGRWRSEAYASGEPWPPAYAPFARAKYLATLQSGARVLLRFEGFAGVDALATTTVEEAHARQRARAAQGFSPAPLGLAHGYLITPWIDGARLAAGAIANDASLTHALARYVASSAGAPLAPHEHEAALARLGEMLCTNARAALGEAAAAQAAQKLARARCAATARGEADVRSAEGSCAAPEGWIRDPRGRVWKVSASGRDHTLVGPQPIAWDVAATLIEWRMPSRAAAALVAVYRAAGGPPLDDASLCFYRAAYAALWLGICSICAGRAASEPAERARLERATEAYRRALARALFPAAARATIRPSSGRAPR